MDNEYIKFASYYMIFEDTNGSCNVRFYDREGVQVRLLYFSWTEREDDEEFKRLLDSKLDPNHKGNMRPSLIKIYGSDKGRTIGFFDRNDNLYYHKHYDGQAKLENILNDDSLEINQYFDKEYMEQTKRVKIVNQYDSFLNKFGNTVSDYWTSFTSKYL